VIADEDAPASATELGDQVERWWRRSGREKGTGDPIDTDSAELGSSLYGCGVTTAYVPADPAAPTRPVEVPTRSVWDRRTRRVLRLAPDAPRASLFGAHGAFSKSIAISATRCLFTYIFLPLMAPLGLSGGVGPLVGVTLSVVSITAIWFATRRFFAADHKYRWAYAGVGGGIVALLVVQGLIDLVALAT
jgi:hypothetical protein